MASEILADIHIRGCIPVENLKKDRKAWRILTGCLDADSITLVEHSGTTAVAWARLYNYFSTASSRESGAIFRQISTYECSEDMDVDQWLTDMRNLYSRYKAHGGTNMSDPLFADN
ncbi:hypothetical protein SISNIDRAFT_492098 [Sistotremastrum niveocremeum HHB9708]|uniref:Uncharacterized protein n=1 Tax=Sistotremastrum niveocremeum HHB9708 TaxID=1314777 RepID=A0A164M2S1_9AGAM|nr:hypothetical protein SISNIDRAFT_492098 [Sistotremastrum niveocremeum HHB9708]